MQLAVHGGATVVATAAARHGDRLRALGAEQVVDSHAADWAAHLEGGFDAVLVAAMGTAAAAISVLRDGGRLCSITSDAPAAERDITSTNLYISPDADQLRRLATEAAEGRLTLDTRAVRLEDAPPIAQQVTSGGSGTTKIRPHAVLNRPATTRSTSRPGGRGADRAAVRDSDSALRHRAGNLLRVEDRAEPGSRRPIRNREARAIDRLIA